MLRILSLLFLTYIFSFCTPLIPGSYTDDQNDELIFKDHIYKDHIKTVQLYPDIGVPDASLRASVLTLQGSEKLILEFDALQEEAENYYAKIIHCNSNWGRSNLNELDYLNEYNEFHVDDYQYSFDTAIPYVHYYFRVPTVKIPGNYLLLIYRGNEENKILTRRFMVFENNVKLITESILPRLNSIVRFNQQLQFEIDYSKINIVNPLQAVSISIRQNQRWDNAIFDLKPTFVKEDLRILEYKHFNFENNFRAGNEFRFFDLRSLRYFGQNVETVRMEQDRVTASIMVDKPRTSQAYGQVDEDLNGQYQIINLDTGSPDVEGDYIDVIFSLETPPINGDVYIFGKLTDWDLKDPMTYNYSFGGYQGNLLLKQGWYDYMYYVKSDTLESHYFEGSHFETENQYEILVYYRPPDLRADLLIGYFSFGVNQ